MHLYEFAGMISVTEVDLCEVVVLLTLVQLLLDPPPAFDCVGQILVEFGIGAFSGRMKQFQKRGYGLVNRRFVTALKTISQLGALFHRRVEVSVLVQEMKRLGQVIRDEPVFVGQQVAGIGRQFPPRDVRMKTMNDRNVKVKRQRLEEI